MTPESEKPTTRRPYQPPRLERIELKTDEVLGTACKSSSPNAGNQTVLSCDTLPQSCST